MDAASSTPARPCEGRPTSFARSSSTSPTKNSQLPSPSKLYAQIPPAKKATASPRINPSAASKIHFMPRDPTRPAPGLM
jgi:hypothetical protein